MTNHWFLDHKNSALARNQPAVVPQLLSASSQRRHRSAQTSSSRAAGRASTVPTRPMGPTSSRSDALNAIPFSLQGGRCALFPESIPNSCHSKRMAACPPLED